VRPLYGGVDYVRQADLRGLDLQRARATTPHEFLSIERRALLCKKGRPCPRNYLSDRTPWRGTARAPSIGIGIGNFPNWSVSTCRWKL
jgi:hypothetical protein